MNRNYYKINEIGIGPPLGMVGMPCSMIAFWVYPGIDVGFADMAGSVCSKIWVKTDHHYVLIAENMNLEEAKQIILDFVNHRLL